MKKACIFLSMFTVLFLSGCTNAKYQTMDNMTWESDRFNIEATSEQLLKQYETPSDEMFNLDTKYYSSIEINNNTYFCIIELVNGYFTLYLVQPELLVNYYEYSDPNIPFFIGEFSDEKIDNEDYQYKLIIELDGSSTSVGTSDGGESHSIYYEYCVDNGIDFDNSLVLYGYESN